SDEYIGGINKAVKDGVILDIDNKVKSSATNYLKKLNENPNFLKSVKTYDGKILTFNTIKDSPKVNSYYGPQIRKDWLDKLGLAVPKTIDEWHEVLMAFKTKDPNGNGKMDEIPFAEDKQMNFSAFSAAWGVLKGEFYKNPKGEFVYGSIEPEFKSYLETMNKWYGEGLIDSEFAAMPSKKVDENMTSDISGAYVGYIGSQMGNYLATKSKENPDYNIVGTSWPIGPAGKDYCAFTNMLKQVENGYGTAITTTNKHVEESIKLLDFNYSEEGIALHNWGIEGKTYDKENSGYKYSDLIVKNPDGKDPINVLAKYTLPIFGGFGKVMNGDAYEAISQVFPQQKEAAETWTKGDNSLLMQSISYTEDESIKINNIMSSIKKYEDDMFVKIIMGITPISEFDNYVKEIKTMGIDEVIQIKKKAYERYESLK
ncbi:MAG: extracellular solute-binding protein, partial [Oscillospiraceae bacterium]